jgi:hypothetical protein
MLGSAMTVMLGLSVSASTSSKMSSSPQFVSAQSGATISRRLSQRPVVRSRRLESAASLRTRPTGELTAVHLDNLDKTIEECIRWGS